jgi:hypothetical protein
VKNPSCEKVEIEWLGTYTFGVFGYKIIIPKEEVLLQSSIDGEPIWGKPKQETALEEAILQILTENSVYDEDMILSDTFSKVVNSKIEIAKWQEKRMYSEEELKSAFKIGFNIGYGSPVSELDLKNEHCEKWFNEFKNK